MKPSRHLLALAVFLLLLGLLSAGVHTFTQNNTLGTDFFIFWQAGRGFLLDRTSPYSEEFALRSQMAVYKRPAAPGEDQLGFAYPPFSILAILPLLFLPFDWASAVWLALLILGWAAAVFLITRRAPLWPGLLIAAFYPVFFGLVLGNFVSLAAALLAVLAGLYLFAERPGAGPQILAGAAAAFLLIKPQFSWLYVAILLLHGLRRPPEGLFDGIRRRSDFLWPGLLLDLAALAAGMAGGGHALRGLQPDLADRDRAAARPAARGLGPGSRCTGPGSGDGRHPFLPFSLVVRATGPPVPAGLGRPGGVPGPSPRKIVRTPGVPRAPAGVGLPPPAAPVVRGAGLVAGQPGRLVAGLRPVFQPAGVRRGDRVAGVGLRRLGGLVVAPRNSPWLCARGGKFTELHFAGACPSRSVPPKTHPSLKPDWPD